MVTEKAASWGGTPTYHFNMPMNTFRTPSSSTLDRATNDPGADPSTPQIKFVWKRDGKMTKDISCFMTGKSTDTQKKKKGGKEPDIAVAIFSGFRDLTMYESNLHRVEMEDYKGLEVVLLLSACVIRDIYCGQKKDCFNVGEAPRKNSGGLIKRKTSTPMLSGIAVNNYSPAPAVQPPVQSNGLPIRQQRRQSIPVNNIPSQQQQQHHHYGRGAPPPDPRAQWEIEAESARLRANVEAEKRLEESRRRERLRKEEEEQKRIRKMLEAEEKERRRRQVEIDKETERLRKKYGDQSNLVQKPRPSSSGHGHGRGSSFPSFGGLGNNPYNARPGPPAQQQRPSQPPRPHTTKPTAQRPNAPRPSAPRPSAGPYLQPHGFYGAPAASQSSFFHGGASQQQQAQQRPKPKKSFFGLRGHSDHQANASSRTLSRQRSTMF